MSALRTTVLVGTALVAFAGNSILCRAALATGHADPATFTAVRLVAGAVVLAALVRVRGGSLGVARAGTGYRALALFAYASLFSWAYVRIPAGVGALVLFGFVQLTMIAAAVRAGAGPRGVQWAGIGLALAGLAALALRGVTAPDPLGVGMMAGAGVAWGVYTLRGRRLSAPLSTTATSFLGAVPLAVVTLGVVAGLGGLRSDATGLACALASGGLASGLGYAVWYAVLPSIDTTRAAAVQLAVPVLAAAAGVVVLGEALTARLVGASAAVLLGIALATIRSRRVRPEVHQSGGR